MDTAQRLLATASMSPETDRPRTDAGDAVPDGLSEQHQRAPEGWRRAASPLALVLLTLLMIISLTGLAGVEETRIEDMSVAIVTWHAPARIRNGEFFEMRLHVDAREAIDELVIGVDATLWEDFTINTFFPAAAEETSEQGELLFTFGPLEADGTFLMKVDAQINPDMLWRNEGTVTVYDGEQVLVEMPIVIEVLP